MRYVILFFSIFVSSASSALDCRFQNLPPSLEQQYCKGRELGEVAREIFRTQPYLYSSKQFHEVQKWTKYYQNHQRLVSLTMQVISNPGMSSFLPLEREYLRLHAITEKLIGELPKNLELHHSINAEGDPRDLWFYKLRTAFDTMIPAKENGVVAFADYKMHDCDYVSQPVNILWFSLNALQIINEIGELKHGMRWTNAVAEKTEVLAFDPSSFVRSIFSEYN